MSFEQGKYRKCSERGCEGPAIRHDESGLCQSCKIKSGLSSYEAKAGAVEIWRERLGIRPGMSKETALELFREWKSRSATCDRCEEKKYVSFCPVHLICEEAENVEEKGGKGEVRGVENTIPQMAFSYLLDGKTIDL